MTHFQFKFTSEKVLTLENHDYNRGNSDLIDTNLNPNYVTENYLTTYTIKFDPILNKYDIFSKKHHREKLFKDIGEIDWDNEYKIKISKRDINPYEDVFETY